MVCGQPMQFLFRSDASIGIGTGHIVRCATLAQYLVQAGHEVQFLAREVRGNLNGWLEAQGFSVTRLPEMGNNSIAEIDDAGASRSALQVQHYDWIVVDHYGLGVTWEEATAAVATRMFVIDDLGRPHHCNLLLDQNYHNSIHDFYRNKVPAGCELLLGPQFALVRPEFARLRPVSLSRRSGELSRILVSMGGSDPLNETTKVLNGIAAAKRSSLSVDVVIGSTNPHIDAVEVACGGLSDVTLHLQTSRMAELMTAADCAIGAAGSTTWERCVLGLPALVTILAPNQAPIAQAVGAIGGHHVIGWHDALTVEDYADAVRALNGQNLNHMSKVAASICDGNGAARVVSCLSQQRASNVPSGTSHA